MCEKDSNEGKGLTTDRAGEILANIYNGSGLSENSPASERIDFLRKKFPDTIADGECPQ